MAQPSNSTFVEPAWTPILTIVGSDKIPFYLIDTLTINYIGETVFQFLSLSNLFKVLGLLFLVANFKVFPFIYHLRLLNGVRFVLQSQRPKEDVGPQHLFRPIITSSRAPIMEIDVYGHKSNSTYFADVDIARVHLVTTLFGKGIAKIRGHTTMNALSGKNASNLTMALGGVSCTFRKEIRPYEAYDMWTRVLSWDRKWLYLVTHFVPKRSNINPRDYTLYPEQKGRGHGSLYRHSSGNSAKVEAGKVQNSASTASARLEPRIAASAMSKIVFKLGRKTIPPQDILEKSGLLPLHPNMQTNTGPDCSSAEKPAGPDSKPEIQSNCRKDQTQELTWDAIELERVRGMNMATLLEQQAGLEDEFDDDLAVCRHYDGYGVEGVLATLAQLGRLSSYQLL